MSDTQSYSSSLKLCKKSYKRVTHLWELLCVVASLLGPVLPLALASDFALRSARVRGKKRHWRWSPICLVFAFTFMSLYLLSPARQTLLLPTQLGNRGVPHGALYVVWMVGILCCVVMEAFGTKFYHIANKAETDFLWFFWLHVWVDVYKGHKPIEEGFVTIKEYGEYVHTQ